MTAIAGVVMYLTRNALQAGLRKEACLDASRLYLLFRLPAMALAVCFYLACGGYDATVAIGRSALPALPDCFTWLLCTLTTLGVLYCNLRRDIRDGFDRAHMTAYTLGTCGVILMIAMKFFDSSLVTLSLVYPLAAAVCYMGQRLKSRTLSLAALVMFALASIGIYQLHYGDFATPVRILYSAFVYITAVATVFLNRDRLGHLCYPLASYGLLAIFLAVFAGFETSAMLLIPALIHAFAALRSGDGTQLAAAACGFTALALLFVATVCPLAPALLPVAGCLLPAAFAAVGGSKILSELAGAMNVFSSDDEPQTERKSDIEVPYMPGFVIALIVAIVAALALTSEYGQAPEELLQNVYEETAPKAIRIMAILISGAFGLFMLLKSGKRGGSGALRFGGLYLALTALAAVTAMATGCDFASQATEAQSAAAVHIMDGQWGNVKLAGSILVPLMAGIMVFFSLRAAGSARKNKALETRNEDASRNSRYLVLGAYVSAVGFMAGTLRILLGTLPGISFYSLLIYGGLAAFALMTTPILLANPQFGGFRRWYVSAKLYGLLALLMLGMLEASQTVFSLSGIALALAILIWGFLRHDSRFRIAGLAAASVFVIKLILADISYNSDLTKALSFVGSGLILLAISLLYNRMKNWDESSSRLDAAPENNNDGRRS